MAEIEITPENTNQVAIQVEQPEVDATAHEAAKINTLVDASAGVDPSQRYLDPEYDPATGFLNDLETVRTEQMLRRRSRLSEEVGDVSPSDVEIAQYRNDMAGGNGLLGPYRQKALQMNEGLEGDKTDELAFALMYRMELAKEFGDISLAETAGDIAGLFVPYPREGHNVTALARDLGFLEGLGETAGSMLDPGSTMESLRNIAINLKPEDRAKMLDSVMYHLRDLDNNMIKQQIITGIFSGDFDPDLMTFFNALDVADFTLSTASIGIVAKKLYDTGKVVNLFKKAPTFEGHAAIRTVAKNPEVSAASGVTPAQVADLQNPIVHGDRGLDLTGASDDLASEITAMWELQDARVRSLNETALREGVLTPERQLEVMRAAEEEIRKQRYVTDLTTTKTDTGFTINFTESRLNPETQQMETVKQNQKIDFLVNDQGNITVDLERDYVEGWSRLDPNSRLKGRVQQELVSTAEHLTREQGKTISALNKSLQDAYKSLSKKEAAKLDEILMQGSKEAKEYSVQELKDMGHSDKIIKAYMGQRNLTYHLHKFENKRLVDEMIAENVRLVEIDGAEIAARHYDEVQEAKNAYRSLESDSFSVYVADDGLGSAKAGQRLDFDSADEFINSYIDDAYSRDFRLVKNYHTQNKFRTSDNITDWALVKPNRIMHPEGRQVINRLPGYVARSRKDSFYFVKTSRPVEISNPKKGIDGVKKSDVTVAWADNLADAEAYAKSLGGEAKGYRVAFDREIDPGMLKGDMLLTRGGLFGGKRKSEELLFVGKDQSLDYESSLDMMQRYINHIGRQIPAHLWRLGNEKRLLERAKQMMPEANIKKVEDILPIAERKWTKAGKEYAFLKDMVEQIQNINAIPTADEIALAKKFERIGNFFEGVKGLEWVSKYFYRASQRRLNIADRIRGVTFTHMLGMYNPAQFLVQASGSVVAFAVNPVDSIKAFPKLIGWQMLDGLAHDPMAQQRAADWLRTQGLGDYADSYMIWSKSGFREAVTDSNSDIATMFGNKPYNAGVIQKAFANNAVFYEMGELAMSRASVATAVEWYKSANKIKKININDDNALKAIYKRAEQYRLNMGRANRSDLNKGLKAVPLQFQQVISKYYEKVLPKKLGGTDEFTWQEKARLFAIPTALTGAAAVPFLPFAVENMAQMAGVDLSELSPEEAELFKSGTVGWMMTNAFDLNVDLSSRMALGSDLWDRMLMFGSAGGGHMFATLLGPAGVVGTRYTQGAQYFWNAVDLTTEAETFTADEMILVGKVLGDTLASLPSGARNIKHYLPHILSDNKAFVKDGRWLWDWEDMNTQTAVMAAIGFQPNEMIDLYDLANEMKDAPRAKRLKLMKTSEDVIAHIIHTGILGTDKEHEQQLKAKMVKAVLSGYEAPDAHKILKGVFKNLNSPEYDTDKLYWQFKMHNLSRLEEGYNFINRIVSQKTQEAGEVE